MKLSIIGLGAVGIMYAEILSKGLGPEDLRIIADRDRISRYRREGVFCNGKKCDFRYTPPEEAVEPADILLFTTKSTGLVQAAESAKGHVGPDTIILSAVNGITSEEIIGGKLGQDHMLYAVAQGMDATKRGNRLRYTQTGVLCFGDREPGIFSEKTRRAEWLLNSVGFPIEVADNMRERQWGKLMLNVGLNQTAAVFGENYGGLQKEGKHREIMIAAMREVMAVAEPEGFHLTDRDLAYWLALLDTLNPEGKPSMAQDAEAKRPSEVELFAGTICRLGQKHGIHTPVNDFFYEKIQEMEAGYQLPDLS